jgi:hypothetical protein
VGTSLLCVCFKQDEIDATCGVDLRIEVNAEFWL